MGHQGLALKLCLYNKYIVFTRLDIYLIVLEEGDKNGDYRGARESNNKPVNTSVYLFCIQMVSSCLSQIMCFTLGE